MSNSKKPKSEITRLLVELKAMERLGIVLKESAAANTTLANPKGNGDYINAIKAFEVVEAAAKDAQEILKEAIDEP